MSNFLSEPFEVVNPQSSINQPLIEKVLSVRQGKYDANKAKVDQTLAIYQNQLKGLSDTDNQYISARLDEAKNMMDNYGNRDFSLSTTTDTLLSSLKSVTEDPIIQSAVMNKQKYDNYNLQVDEIKKKHPELYSDKNYTDGLEQGGVYAYKEGKIKNIDSLKYQEYVNVPEKLNKKAEDYVKLMGKKQLLDTTTGQYYISDTYGEKVYMSDIYRSLEAGLDDKDKGQLRIDARQSLGKLTKDELDVVISPAIKEDLTQIKLDKAAIEAQIKSEGDQTKKDILGQKLLVYDDTIKNYQSQLDNKSYDIYSNYKQSLLKNIASNYDYSIITEVKRDDMPFQVYKFEAEQFDRERNFKLKEKEVSDKGTQALSAPTIIEKPAPTDSVKPSEESVLRNNLKTSESTLDTYLKKSNENDYNKKTSSEQWQYKINLKSDDPTVEGNTLERQNLIKSFKTTQKGYAELINNNSTILQEGIAKEFNSITGAKINNLAGELPYTVSALKMGKKFEDLDKNVQKGIIVEMGSNWIRQGDSHTISDRQKLILESSLNSIAVQLQNHPSDKVKNIYKLIEPAYKGREPARFLIYMPGGLAAPNPLFFNENLSFKQDSDLTEIEQSAGDASLDFVDHFSSVMKSIEKQTNDKASDLNKNLVSNKAMAFSTESKEQAADALRLQSVIQVNYPNSKPSDKNNYIISKQGQGFNISFTEDFGKEKRQQTYYVDKLDENLAQKMNTQENSWNNSYLNRNLILPSYTFTVKNREQAQTKFMSLAKNRPDILPTEVYIGLFNRGSLAGTELQSDEDILDNVRGKTNYTPEKETKILNILNAQFTPVFDTEGGVLKANINITLPDGKKDYWMMSSNTRELDEGRVYMEVLTEIGKYKKAKIDQILSQK